MVQSDRESLGLQVREKIDLGVVYLAQERACIIGGAGELRVEQRHHGHFRSVRPEIVIEVAFDSVQRSTRHRRLTEVGEDLRHATP